jgi:hypothetical protein
MRSFGTLEAMIPSFFEFATIGHMYTSSPYFNVHTWLSATKCIPYRRPSMPIFVHFTRGRSDYILPFVIPEGEVLS